MAKLDVKTLGHSGVLIDPNTLEPTIPLDALRLAQNATHDPKAGYGGGLRKRAGLARFNSASAGGVILGGIPMAVAGTGGAPVHGGGGFTGSGEGGGDGTGAPGGTTDGSSAAYVAAGAAQFNSGTKLFSGARLIVIGRDDNTSSSIGAGWFVTSKNIADAAVSATTPGPPGVPYSYPPTTLFPSASGLPMAFYAPTGFLFYAKAHVQTTGTACTIRKTNAATDSLVCTIPTNSYSDALVSGVVRSVITALHVGADGYIYVTVKDKADGQSTNINVGRVFKLDPATGTLTEINFGTVPATSPAEYNAIPYAVAFHQGSVYVGEFNLASSELHTDTNADIRATTTDQSYAGIDHGFSDGEATTVLYVFPQTAPASNPSMDVLSNRCLFAGFGVKKATPVKCHIYSRNRLAIQDSTAWTHQMQAADGGSAANGNYIVAMVAFNDKLYASYYNPSVSAKIYEFTPDYTSHAADGGWSGSGTWAEVFANAGGSDLRPFQLFVDQGVMYAIGALGLGSRYVMISTNGSSWTNVTSNIGTFSNQSYPTPIFAGFDQ